MSTAVAAISPSSETQYSERTASLASCFQEVLTAIVRVRFRQQRVEDAHAFRVQIRHALQLMTQHARSLGYKGDSVRTAVFAAVAFLDESVLNLQDPAFADWARRPLQEELFGGHLAGESFFKNLRVYLGQPDSPETADVLEVHCLCMLMGYRGRYALHDSGELFAMLRQARERIQRIRGEVILTPSAAAKLGAVPEANKWNPRLFWTVAALLLAATLLFAGYRISLAAHLPSSADSTQDAAEPLHASRSTDIAAPREMRGQTA